MDPDTPIHVFALTYVSQTEGPLRGLSKHRCPHTTAYALLCVSWPEVADRIANLSCETCRAFADEFPFDPDFDEDILRRHGIQCPCNRCGKSAIPLTPEKLKKEGWIP